MKVSEVIKESLYDFFANRQQRKTAVKSMAPGYQGPETQAFKKATDPFYQQQAAKQQAAQQATQQPTVTKQVRNPPQGTVLLIKDPRGMEYFKNYKGLWFEKPDSREKFVASGALQIKDPVQANALNSMLTQVGGVVIAVKPEFPGDNVNFEPDPVAQRRLDKRQQGLAAKRQRTKK